MTREEVERIAHFSSDLRAIIGDLQNDLISTTHPHNEGDIITLVTELESEVDILDEHSRRLDDIEFTDSLRPKTPKPTKK